MEIIYKSTKELSNFEYHSNLFKNKKVLNGFNKLEEGLSEMVADNDFECQDLSFNKDLTATIYLCYPLSVVVKETIHFSTLHELISEIRKVYRKIYRGVKKYGIWGHGICDLVIETIKLYEDNGTVLVNVGIGS